MVKQFFFDVWTFGTFDFYDEHLTNSNHHHSCLLRYTFVIKIGDFIIPSSSWKQITVRTYWNMFFSTLTTMPSSVLPTSGRLNEPCFLEKNFAKHAIRALLRRLQGPTRCDTRLPLVGCYCCCCYCWYCSRITFGWPRTSTPSRSRRQRLILFIRPWMSTPGGS